MELEILGAGGEIGLTLDLIPAFSPGEKEQRSQLLSPTRDWIGSSVLNLPAARKGMSSPWGEETGEGGRANKSKYPQGIKAPEARHSCRTPIHKMKKPRHGRHRRKVSLLTELEILGAGLLQRWRADGAQDMKSRILPSASRTGPLALGFSANIFCNALSQFSMCSIKRFASRVSQNSPSSNISSLSKYGLISRNNSMTSICKSVPANCVLMNS